MNELVLYRFKTKTVDDYRPLVDMKDIQMPWWCTEDYFVANTLVIGVVFPEIALVV